MDNYSATVAAIANDYLRRVRAQLRLIPTHEQDDFLREVESHLYEAYQREPAGDDVARILAVLRNLGEPAEVVADRLPGSMVRSGASRNLPLFVLGGILVALFGLPLGFGGVAVVAGLLLALGALVLAYYAVAGSVLFVGVAFGLLGIMRVSLPGLFDRLVTMGFIQMGPPGGFVDQLSPAYQGLFLLLFAAMFVAGGLGMLRLGKRMLRGFRFLVSLVFDWLRRFAQKTRAKLSAGYRDRRRGTGTEYEPVAGRR
jgi:uncharacterized membrane protein